MHFLEFLSKNVDYDKQFMEFLSLLQKHGLSYENSKIYFPFPKTWTIICNFWNFFPFSKNVDYYMHFLEFLSKYVDYDKQFMEFLSLLHKHGLSYDISKISFPSQKTWTIRCNFWNFFPFSKTWTIICSFVISYPSPNTWTILWNIWNFFPFSKNVDYHMHFLEFLSLPHIHGLSYAISRIPFPSPKTWTIIFNF